MNREKRVENAMYFSFAAALTATIGSLYFSEVEGLIPCELCWYQRILMYPLVVLLGIAAVRKDYNQSNYILPLASIGACFSLYHYLLQKNVFGQDAGGSCAGNIPCNLEYINVFGFITIPFLALTAFTIIILLQVYVWRNKRRI